MWRGILHEAVGTVLVYQDEKCTENDIKLQNNSCYITEIKLEQQSSSQNKRTRSTVKATH